MDGFLDEVPQESLVELVMYRRGRPKEKRVLSTSDIKRGRQKGEKISPRSKQLLVSGSLNQSKGSLG